MRVDNRNPFVARVDAFAPIEEPVLVREEEDDDEEESDLALVAVLG